MASAPTEDRIRISRESLLKEAYKAALKSYAPYSKQLCGAAVCTVSGNKYIGCTVDNAAYPNSSCAVLNAVNKAVSAEIGKVTGPDKLQIVACAYIEVSAEPIAAPCGVSCQALLEHGDFPVYIGECSTTECDLSEPILYKETSVLQLMPLAKIYKIKDFEAYDATKSQFSGLRVDTLINESGERTIGTVLELAKAAVEASKYAYVPYSHFPVGAAILTENGIIVGCNVENISFRVTSCGERTAISNAISAGSRHFQGIAVACVKATQDFSKPCGACRQSLVEFGNFAVYCLKNLGDNHWAYHTCMAHDILPSGFLPSNLAEKSLW